MNGLEIEPDPRDGAPPPGGPELPANPVRPGRLRHLYLMLRMEHTTPKKLAAGIGVGVFVGTSPFWGLHLGICVLLATIFRLNRLLVYTVANVASIPALFVVFAEIQVGHKVLHRHWFDLGLGELRDKGTEAFVLSLVAQIREAGVTGIVASFVVGGVIVAAVLGLAAGLIAWLIARTGHSDAWHELANRIALRFAHVSIRDAEGARARLLSDPIFPFMFHEPSIAQARRVLDMGCGRGVAAALLAEIAGRDASFTYVGVDRSDRYVRAAREALEGVGDVSLVAADLRDFDPPPADVALLLNVLRYLPVPSQDALLRRLGKALPPGAHLFVREIDAGGGWRARWARVRETLSQLPPGRSFGGHHLRRASDLRNALVAAGFEVRDRTTVHAVSRARVLLEAIRRPQAVR